MPTLASISVAIKANSANFQTGMKKAGKRLDAFSRKSKKASKVVGNIFKNAAVAGVAGGGAFAALAKRTSESADAIGKTADKLGIGIEALQEYRFAAEKAGVASNTFDLALQRFIRRSAEAAQGTGEAKDALKSLGIQVKDANGNIRGTEDLLGELGDKFARVQNPADKLRLAFKLFDSEGAALVNLFGQGSKAIDTFREQARKAGFVLSEDLVRAAEKSNDQFKLMGRIFEGRIAKAVIPLTPLFLKLGDQFTNMIGTSEQLGNKLSFLSNFLKVIGTTTTVVAAVFSTLGKAIGSTAAAMVQFASGNFTNSFNIIKEGLGDSRDTITTALEDIRKTWKEGAQKIADSAPKASEQITSPLVLANAQLAKDKERLQKSINETINGLKFEASTIGKTADQITLFKLRLDGASASQLAAAKAALDTVSAYDKQQDSIDKAKSIIESIKTPLEQFQDKVIALNDALNTGVLSYNQYNVAIGRYQDELEAATKKTDELGEFAKQAARNIQDSLGDTLFNVLDGKFDNIGQSFDKLIKRMIANAAAAKIGESLFPNLNKDGGGTGNNFFDGLLGSLIPKFADGTNFAPGGVALVGERGPELVNLPRGSSVTPNDQIGGMTVVNNFTVNGQADSRSQQQIADAAFRGVSRANQRNG